MLDLAPYDEPDHKTIIDTVGIQHMGEVEHQEYMVLTDEDEIDEHAQRFFDNLEDRCTITIEKMDLGMQGATQAVQNAKHNARKNIWWYPNREPWGNRYWNCFGVGKPDSTGPNSITRPYAYYGLLIRIADSCQCGRSTSGESRSCCHTDAGSASLTEEERNRNKTVNSIRARVKHAIKCETVCPRCKPVHRHKRGVRLRLWHSGRTCQLSHRMAGIVDGSYELG